MLGADVEWQPIAFAFLLRAQNRRPWSFEQSTRTIGIAECEARAAALTRQLLMFSRKQVIQPKVLDLNAVLQNTAKMLQRLLGEDIALEANYGPNLPRIEADTGMLEQVIMNLAVNSRDAMPKGGKLVIGTSHVEIQQAYASQHPDSRLGQFVCLSVTDTGSGMDNKTLERIAGAASALDCSSAKPVVSTDGQETVIPPCGMPERRTESVGRVSR